MFNKAAAGTSADVVEYLLSFAGMHNILHDDLTTTTRNKDIFHQLIAWMVSRGYEHKIAKWQRPNICKLMSAEDSFHFVADVLAVVGQKFRFGRRA